jgi:YfiH family protein
MPFHTAGNIRFYSHSILDEFGVKHGYFTRHGGISPKPWDSLNVGLGQDDPRRVHENRLIAFNSVGRDPSSIFDVWQVHTSNVICVSAPKRRDEDYQMADGILTNNPSVTLFMRFADCVPVLLFDPMNYVVGLAHAGWQGTLKNIVLSAVEKMKTVYHSNSEDLIVCLGPSIGPDHYAIGDEVEHRVKMVFGSDAEQVLVMNKGNKHFDLWQANRLLLERVGVSQVVNSGICTACNVGDWFSHRQENGQTGRFGAFIALNSI